MLLLIISDSTEAVQATGDAGATVLGVAQEVADADVVITTGGKLVKDRYGDVEVRVA